MRQSSGVSFPYAWLQEVSQWMRRCRAGAGRLVEGRDCVPTGGATPSGPTCFKHALIQDAAYESLLKSTRQSYHQRLARSWKPSFLRRLRHSLSCWHTTGQQQADGSSGRMLASRWQRAIERSGPCRSDCPSPSRAGATRNAPRDPTASPARSEHV